MKAALAISTSAVFVVLLGVLHYLHFAYLQVDVVFYAAMADGVAAALLAGVLLFGLPRLRVLGGLEKSLLLVVWLLAGYAFAISVPTVIDRSLSFYLLEKLQQRGGKIRLSAMEDIIRQEYMKEHRLVDVRLTEQLESGTIRIENGCVILTERGQWLARLSRSYRLHLLPKRRLLMGQYSDALVDPFRNGRRDGNYGCN